MEASEPQRDPQRELFTLIYSIFIAGLCSIVYELQIATTSSYFEGDSVKQFSLVIGIYMASMGAGSYISKFFVQGLIQKFIVSEILLGLVGGLSVPLIYLVFAYTDHTQLFTLFVTALIGTLIGFEIPLLTRLMDEFRELRVSIASVLSLDYVGALLATISFPFFLLPFLGSYKTSIILGLINMSIGYINLWCFRKRINNRTYHGCMVGSICSTAILLTAFFVADPFFQHWNSSVFDDRVVYSEQTKYQNIVLTKDRRDIRLYLNGNLQFSSLDEYRYHESLIHVPMMNLSGPVNVLLLGAGDGLAVRELLKYRQVESITLVDLDEKMVRLGKRNHYLSQLNENSLFSPKVQILHKDAFRFLLRTTEKFDLIISDLPDPNNNDLARLYSREFYKMVFSRMKNQGVFVAQATSPYFAPKAFWCIVKTIESINQFSDIRPYHVHIPSFGDWGFVIAKKTDVIEFSPPVVPTKFIDESIMVSLFHFGKDMPRINVAPNSLDQPRLLSYYLEGWRHW